MTPNEFNTLVDRLVREAHEDMKRTYERDQGVQDTAGLAMLIKAEYAALHKMNNALRTYLDIKG